MTTGSKTNRIYPVKSCTLEKGECFFQIGFWCRHTSSRVCRCSIHTTCAIWQIMTSTKIIRHSAPQGYEICHYKVVSRLPNHDDQDVRLTRYRIVDKRSPKGEAIVECAAGIFAPRCFKTYTCIYATSSCADIRGYEIVEQDSHPLSSSRATAVKRGCPFLSDIVCAWCNRRRKV
jgi:hypothetical protein